MKTSKIISFVAGLAMCATLGATCITAQAAVNEGISLEMNSESTVTTRKFDMYYVGELSDVGSFSVALAFPSDLTFASTPKFALNGDITIDYGTSVDLIDGCYVVSGTGATANAVGDDGLLLGTVTFGVAETVGDVTVTVDVDTANTWVCDSMMSAISGAGAGGVAMDASSLTVVKELVTAEALTVAEAGTYDYWEDGVVNAFTATLTAEQTAKTVTWTVTDGTTTKTADTKVDTTVTGDDGSVVIGLIVKNATSVQASASVK